jgi:hypothetical protein
MRRPEMGKLLNEIRKKQLQDELRRLTADGTA